MRVVTLLLVLLFAVAGAVFGALNETPIRIDLYWWSFSIPQGLALLLAALFGALLAGLLLLLGVIWPQRRRLARAVSHSAPAPPAQGAMTPNAQDRVLLERSA
jgi:putative membrane protein